MKKVLVTGCAGFVGSNLCKKLIEANYSVIGIDNLSAGTLENVPKKVEFFNLDIRSNEIYSLFEGVDVVFHLAAKNCLSDCLKNPIETSDINATGTVNILEAGRLAKVKKFIYADTSAEYEGVYDFPSKVDTVKPLGVYSTAKRAGALFCESYKNLYSMKITIVRYFNVYGPAQDYRRMIPPVMSAFIIKLLNGEQPIIYGNGEKRRDFIYVDDVNDFHMICIEDQRTDGNIYNLGTGVNYSINDIFNYVENILKTGIRPIFHNELPGEAQITLADISNTKQLGWNPKTDIQKGIRLSIEYINRTLRLNATRNI
jgi:nucleoside-diphosphate-sugar epimerase